MATEVDSARSWAVAVACCWINGFILALVRSSAVVYVGILHAFDVDRQQASWPITLTVICNCFGSKLRTALRASPFSALVQSGLLPAMCRIMEAAILCPSDVS